ncbi:hypothetical protein HUU42_08140 [bacterium]|nr:hypothetical protein [bacterium]
MKSLLVFLMAFAFAAAHASDNESVKSETAPVISKGGEAGFFSPAAVVRSGAFMIGAETQYQFSGPKKFGVLGHLRYGLVPRFEINSDIGIKRGEFYFGAGVDYQIMPDRAGSLGMLFRGGGFINDPVGSGLDLSLMVGNQFSQINIYGGLQTKFIVDPTDVTVFNLIGGIHIPFQRKMAFVGEIGLNVNDKDDSYLSAGVLFGL